MSIEYGPDIEAPPVHLNLAFLEEVAENALRETNLKILKARFSMGSSTGENYCSQIYRVYVEYQSAHSEAAETLPLIVKNVPRTESTAHLKEIQVFLKEKTIYCDVLPRMEILLEKPQKFSARLYHSMKEPENTFVFEDLKASNYEMASRETGLDEAHSRLVVQRIAQFHAASMVLVKKDPSILKCLREGMMAKSALELDKGMLMRFFRDNAEALVARVGQWPGFEAITEKLRQYTANLRENLVRSQAPVPDEIKVLNHGDLWVNNILFKYDSKRQPQDLVFVDYQMSLWSSPGIDLNYFFFTSLQLDILKHKREELLKEYHRVLCDTLQSLNHADIPSYQQIQQEVENRKPYGFVANFGIFPLISMDKESSSDNTMENFMDDDFSRRKMAQIFASKRVEAMLRYTLKHFDESGIWD